MCILAAPVAGCLGDRVGGWGRGAAGSAASLIVVGGKAVDVPVHGEGVSPENRLSPA